MGKWVDWKAVDWLPISASALFLVCSLWALAPSCGPNSCGNYQQTSDGNNKAPSALTVLGNWIERNHDGIDAGSTFVVALFTFILAWSTGGLWTATNKAIRSAEKQNTTVNRAFVSYQDTKESPVRDAAGAIVHRDLMTSWINSGNTPALRYRTHVSWQSRPDELPADFNYPDLGLDDATTKMLGPKAVTSADPLSVPENFFGTVADGQAHFYSWGWMEYDDVFGTRHRTEFCVKMWFLNHPDGQHATIGFRFTGPHNGDDADFLKSTHT
jgi:hypothetical protein